MTWFGAPMIEARNKALRREVAKIGCKNIYTLAEGALPTGLTMTQDPQVRYLHTDLPGMLTDAEVVLRKLMERDNLTRPNLRFMPVNALDRRQLQEGADYFEGQKFIVTNKGLLMYLPEDESSVVASGVRDTLVNNDGIAWITTDFNYKKNLTNVADIFGPAYSKVLQESIGMIARKTRGRNIKENFFEDPDHAARFIDRANLDFVRTPFCDGSFELTSLQYVPDNMRQGIMDIFADRYIYVMTPKK